MEGQLGLETSELIEKLCLEGNELDESGQYREALAVFASALAHIPEPRAIYWEATWLYTAMGEMCFRLSEFERGTEYLALAVGILGLGNPYIHLLLGACQYELNNFPRAKDELARAYMGGGQEIFGQFDPKYFAYVRTFLSPPPDGL